jgi:hypothetical protein
MAYDPSSDALYAFSGTCCKASVKPSVFRLTRGAGRRFHVESYRPLPSDSDFTAAAVRASDGKMYVGLHGNLWPYSYTTNKVGSAYHIPGIDGIRGMSFSADGAALYVITSSKLYRVDWAKKKIVSGWTFALGQLGIKDGRAVEVAGNNLYVSDGDDRRSVRDPLRYAVYVVTTDANSGTNPQAFAGLNQQVAPYAEIHISGAGSRDPDGGPVTYHWAQVGGPPAVIHDDDERTPGAVVGGMKGPATLTLRLTVTNASGRVDTADVTVTVRPK